MLERGGRFWLGDAKWSEFLSPADARRLHQVAGELPAGSVEQQTLICRAPHPYPLGESTSALPLHALAEQWGLNPQLQPPGEGVAPLASPGTQA